jgi:hypothetical protein
LASSASNLVEVVEIGMDSSAFSTFPVKFMRDHFSTIV